METPLVSICSITYNHAPFIRQCLDGFLMQQCNFPIEIIINDDCSTDGTTEIIREYAEKYPDKIFPIFHEENLYSQGVRGMFQKFVYPKARGKYIALCEGDDYWTDPLKLQKQVDFLESHHECSMCFHNVDFISYEGKPNPLRNKSNLKSGYYKRRQVNVATGSSMMKRECALNTPTSNGIIQGDELLWLSCWSTGKVYYMNDIMGVYRHHANSWSITCAPNSPEVLLEEEVMFYEIVTELFPKKMHSYARWRLSKMVIMCQMSKTKTDVIDSLILFRVVYRRCLFAYIINLVDYAFIWLKFRIKKRNF